MEFPEPAEFALLDAATIKRFFGVLRQWLWLILLGTVVGAGLAYFASSQQPRVYQANTRVLISRPIAQSQSLDMNSYLNMQQFTLTYVEFFKLKTVLAEVGKQLNTKISAGQVRTSIVQNTQFIDVIVEDDDPRQAAIIADTLVKVVNEQSDTMQGGRYTSAEASLENQITQMAAQVTAVQQKLNTKPDDALLSKSLAVYQQIYGELIKNREDIRLSKLNNLPTMMQIGQASWNNNPVRPLTRKNTLLGALSGFLMVFAVIIVLYFLDDTLKTKEDVKRKLGLNVIGFMAEFDEQSGGVFVAEKPRSPLSESFRSLRTNLEFLGVDKPVRSILVTSTEPAAGKTTISANLAASLAQNDKKVLLIDVDFRRPHVHNIFGISNRFGLSDLFLDHLEFEDAVQTYKGANDTEFGVITTGALPPNPAELLGSERMRAIIEKAKTLFDFVIMDSPPLMVSDAQVLSPQVDGVLMVILTGQTHGTSAKTLLDPLRNNRVRFLGAVLNRVKSSHIIYGGYESLVQNNKYYGTEAPVNNKNVKSGESKPSLLSFFKRGKKQ